MQARVDPAWFVKCGRRFLKRTVEIVRPRVLVTLGERAYCATASVYNLSPLPFKKAVEREGGFRLAGGHTLYPVYHCGRRILNTHRPIERELQDWARIGRALRG